MDNESTFWRIGFLIVLSHALILAMGVSLALFLRSSPSEIRAVPLAINWTNTRLLDGLAYRFSEYGNLQKLFLAAWNLWGVAGFLCRRKGQPGTIPLVVYVVGQGLVASLVAGSRMYLGSYGVVHFVIPGFGEIEDRLHDREPHETSGGMGEAAFLTAPLFLLAGWWFCRLLPFRRVGNSKASEPTADNS